MNADFKGTHYGAFTAKEHDCADFINEKKKCVLEDVGLLLL